MFGEAQQRLFEGVVQPFLFHFGMANLLEDGYTATGWLLVGLLQIAVMVAVIVPLQRWRPVEPVVDRQAIRVDILYTLIHRLGIFRLALFFTIDPCGMPSWASFMSGACRAFTLTISGRA
jgi:sterol desaturase/sphingolipid hydroxylase (fatty acid hydroxylase superfamily)